MESFNWFSRRHGGAESDGLRWLAPLAHNNLTTLMARMGHHEGHEAIRQQTEHALWKSSTADGGVSLSAGGWHQTAAGLRVSVAPCLRENQQARTFPCRGASIDCVFPANVNCRRPLMQVVSPLRDWKSSKSHYEEHEEREGATDGAIQC